MKLTNAISRILGILGTVLLIVSLVVCVWIQGSQDTMQSVPRQAAARSEALMEALVRGDLDAVEGMLYGKLSLGAYAPETGTLEQLLWDAYIHGFSYQWKSTCYPVGESVCQNVEITALNIPQTMQAISQRTRELLEGQPESGEAAATEPENRDAAIDEAMLRAAREILEQEPQKKTYELTLTFIKSDGAWTAVPDGALRSAISGGLGE